MIKTFKHLILICSLFSSFICSGVSNEQIKQIEELIEKHKLTKEMSAEEKYRAFSVLAYELELFGHLEKSIFYYKKALEYIPKSQDNLQIYTSLLSVLYRVDSNSAKVFYNEEFKSKVNSFDSKLKSKITKFWDKVLQNKEEINNSFYAQFFKDRDVKSLIIKKEYNRAFLLLSPVGLDSANINKRLEYDILSKLNGKNSGFFCLRSLEKFPESASITMEVCRYLIRGKLKFGDLQRLEKRSEEELPHLKYIVKALYDIKGEKQ